jgi:riboflavin kinase/FMN adenylyltransferase
MQVITLPSRSAPPDPMPDLPEGGTVVTIGAYDGVHRGHRELIARTRSTAATLGCATAVVTFDRHPAQVVRPGSAPPLLTDTEQKLELLASTGVELTVLVHFDEERAAEPPEDFVREVIVGLLHARSVVVGHDFHFGRARRGNVELLARLGAELGFDVTGLRLLTMGEAPVSSTRIRSLIAAGRVEEAAALLGRPHELRGRVERGDRRGRALGYPTANVAVPSGIALPADGVYAGWYRTPDKRRHRACISIGRRPTFYRDGAARLVEPYLLDFSGDLYGQQASVEFVSRQRGQVRFESEADLVEQMAADVSETRRLLDEG